LSSSVSQSEAAAIATYIKAAETSTTTVTTRETATMVLKMTPQELAVLSTHDLEQLVLRTQAVMRRCPFKSGCSFCSLPDEYVLDILLTWITIEDLAHFDNALLNRMDRRAYLSLLRDTEHRGVLSVSESSYDFDSGVAVWLESRNVFANCSSKTTTMTKTTTTKTTTMTKTTTTKTTTTLSLSQLDSLNAPGNSCEI
jgi:hypothetical protein